MQVVISLCKEYFYNHSKMLVLRFWNTSLTQAILVYYMPYYLQNRNKLAYVLFIKMKTYLINFKLRETSNLDGVL